MWFASASGCTSPPKLLEQSSAAALLLFCSGSRCHGHVPHGQWVLLDADMLALIDRSARLVDLALVIGHSFTTHLNGSLTGSCLDASHRHSGLRVFRLQPVDQGCDRSSHLAFDRRLCMFTCFSTN